MKAHLVVSHDKQHRNRRIESSLRVMDGAPAPAGRLCPNYSENAGDTTVSTRLRVSYGAPKAAYDQFYGRDKKRR